MEEFNLKDKSKAALNEKIQRVLGQRRREEKLRYDIALNMKGRGLICQYLYSDVGWGIYFSCSGNDCA